MDIKELLKKAFEKGEDNGYQCAMMGTKFTNFEKWYNSEETQQAVKNIAVLDGVSNQRELLTSFYDDLKGKVGEYRIRTISTKKAVESFIKKNQ